MPKASKPNMSETLGAVEPWPPRETGRRCPHEKFSLKKKARVKSLAP